MSNQHGAATADALGERDRVLAEVELAHRDAIDAGMEVLRRWAATGQPFSANNVRGELRAAGVRAESGGALFNAAIKARLIKRVGAETSTDLGTHAKPVNRYIGTGARQAPVERVTVPVQRNRIGRFTSGPDDAGTPSLFDIEAAS
jgi:hypothetical protein